MHDYAGHTPGPMKVIEKLSGSENHRGFYIRSARGFILAEVSPLDFDGREGGANANLWAAAPQLLADLNEAVGLLRRVEAWFAEGRVGVYTNIASDTKTFLSRLDAKGGK